MPKTLNNLFNNIYFLYFIAFLAVFNVFAYIIMNNFNAIILFILISYVTYLFSKNMAIVLLVALLLTNLFLGSNKNRREGMTSDASDATDATDATESTDATDSTDISGNHPVAAKIKNAIANKKNSGAVAPTTAPSTVVPSTTSTSATVTPAVAPTTVTTASAEGLKNIQGLDLDKMNSLLTKSKELMNELKTSFPGMSNILGGGM